MDELLELLERLFGQASTPVRRGLKLHLTMNDEGNPSVEVLGGEAIVLSPENSIDRVEISRDRFYGGCGCTTNVEVGGKCKEPGCNLTYCIRCATRCQVCLKSLCLVCVTRIPTEDGARDFCHVHADDFRWNSLIRRTFGLIPPGRL